MPEPTLSELSNLRVDPDLGGSEPAFVPDNRQTLQILNQAAQVKQENDWKKYNLFLNNLNNVYKDLGDISAMETATADRDELWKQTGSVLQDIYKDPKSFFGAGGAAQRAKIEMGLANLRRNATESKLNRVYDMAHREYLSRNPDLNTEENKAKIEEYWKQPLGSRKPYILGLSGSYDPAALATQLNEAVKQESSRSGLTPDGKFIQTEHFTSYDPQKYKALAEQMYYLPDNRGNTLRTTLSERFSRLPKDIQEKYKKSGGDDPVKEWYMDLQGSYLKPTQSKKDDLKANPFQEIKEKGKIQFGLEAVKQNDRIALEQIKANLRDKPTKETTSYLLQSYGEMLGNTTGNQFTVDLGKGNYETEDIINATPEMLKLFSKPGKTTVKRGASGDETTESEVISNVPNILLRTKDGNIRAVFYKTYNKGDKDANGKVVGTDEDAATVGDIVYDKTGKPIYESASVVPKREIMSILGKNFMEKKQVPGSVNLASEIIDKEFGGNILNYVEALKGGNKPQQQPISKTISRKDISAKASAAGYTPAEYEKLLKEKGIQIVD